MSLKIKFSVVYFLLSIGLSSPSLLFSYIFLTSDPWVEAFLSHGWIIEMFRSLILVSAGIYLLFFVLWQDTKLLLTIGRLTLLENEGTNLRDKKLLKFFQFFLFFFLFLVLSILIKHHFEWGPISLSEKYSSPTVSGKITSFFRAYSLPYIIYLPYAIVNYIFIGVPLVTIGVYAAVNDLLDIHLERNRLKVFLSDTLFKLRKDSSHEDDIQAEESACSLVVRKFESFGFYTIDAISRFSSFVLTLAIIFSFEYWIGRYTLSDVGIRLATIGYGLISLAIILIFLAFFVYTDIFRDCAKALFDMNCNVYREFEEENGFIIFFQRVLRRNLSLYISLFILTLIPPVSEPLANFFNLDF